MSKNAKNTIYTAIATTLFILTIFIICFGSNLKGIIKINQAMNIMNDEFYFELDKEKMVDYAMLGITLSSGDEYTNYYTNEQFQGYMSNRENSFFGIGITVGIIGDNIEIISVFENSPGDKAGIESGDILVRVNDTIASSENYEEIMNILTDDSSKDIEFKLVLKRDGEEYETKIVRGMVEKDTVKSKIIDDSIGYVRISGFDRRVNSDKKAMDTYDEFIYELDKLENKGVDKLVLDLRNNPGGDFEVVTNIADSLLPEGIITYTEDKKGKKEYVYSNDEFYDMEIVVLVNKYSASASEVLTGALKDHKRAIVVGETTYGKGIVQSLYMFNDSSGMSVTTSKYFSPNGISIHQKGIEPDYSIVLTEEENMLVHSLSINEDVQLKKAIELLK